LLCFLLQNQQRLDYSNKKATDGNI
jgi:hypothetical protein